MANERCRWIKDSRSPGGRALIPGCMGTAAHYSSPDPLMFCTCGVPPFTYDVQPEADGDGAYLFVRDSNGAHMDRLHIPAMALRDVARGLAIIAKEAPDAD